MKNILNSQSLLSCHIPCVSVVNNGGNYSLLRNRGLENPDTEKSNNDLSELLSAIKPLEISLICWMLVMP